LYFDDNNQREFSVCYIELVGPIEITALDLRDFPPQHLGWGQAQRTTKMSLLQWTNTISSFLRFISSTAVQVPKYSLRLKTLQSIPSPMHASFFLLCGIVPISMPWLDIKEILGA
jgi:hypothetical protein